MQSVRPIAINQPSSAMSLATERAVSGGVTHGDSTENLLMNLSPPEVLVEASTTNSRSSSSGVTLAPGALALAPGPLALTPGALGLTPGALGLTPGALGLSPGALGLSPGALGLSPGVVACSPTLGPPSPIGTGRLHKQLRPMLTAPSFEQRPPELRDSPWSSTETSTHSRKNSACLPLLDECATNNNTLAIGVARSAPPSQSSVDSGINHYFSSF